MHIVQIESWNHFLKISNHFKAAEKIYRGQTVSSFQLTPSLTRLFKEYKVTRRKAIQIEQELLKEFQQSNGHQFLTQLSHSNHILWWSIMQHFGAPTRLLDWTTDIYIALYFAVNKDFDKEGALFLFDDGHLNFIRHVRKGADWADIDLQLERSIANEDYKISIYAFTNDVPIERKDNQKSCFTISTELTEDLNATHDKLADNLVFENVRNANDQSLVTKYTIDKSLKIEFLKKLTQMNITADYLFPGLDGLGKKTFDLCIQKLW